ncbi:hypothetical protein [Streptomyces sp. NPDC086835]|uniref:hypothetical protein n=1 Tax=Streptomyces sp. NPDC086835 TaxID=3365761 RepID=UPI0038245879
MASDHTLVPVGDEEYVLLCDCPRCGAALELPLFAGVFRQSASAGQGGGGTSHVEPMSCMCLDDHPNRPHDRTGCGAYWTLTITSTP